uniref:Uncharacterized protein n=1 Tax=Avena sativa TaxID=4498 RepID=A0ACD5VCP1_AVESA
MCMREIVPILSAFCDELEAANPSLDDDSNGLIALYEASYLAFPGEAMLDRARALAIEKLQELIPSMKPDQREKTRAILLDLPLHWRAPRLQTLRSLEEHRGRGDRNIIDPSILQLAALDFNLVQAVHRSELLEVTRWWKETGLGEEKLPFARDRLVECFFCAACIAPEPRLAACREVLAKVGSLLVHLDDVYDIYGTLDELAAFTDAVGSAAWDVSSAAAALPEYMKAMYSAIRSTSTAAADRVMKEQGYDAVADAVAETLKEVNREVAFRSTHAADRVCVNLARIMQCIYRDGDGITSPTDNRKRLVKDLLFNPAGPYICDTLAELYGDQ